MIHTYLLIVIFHNTSEIETIFFFYITIELVTKNFSFRVCLFSSDRFIQSLINISFALSHDIPRDRYCWEVVLHIYFRFLYVINVCIMPMARSAGSFTIVRFELNGLKVLKQDCMYHYSGGRSTFFKLSPCYTNRQENEHWESINKTCQTWRIFGCWILEKFICINSCFSNL